VPYVDDEERRAIEDARSASATRQLLVCARLVSERANVLARARTGQHNLRAAHTNVLFHIGLEGSRLTDLATSLGVSKQTASEFVDDLVDMRVLERVNDPSDGRAKLIRFARRRSGRLALFDVLDVLGAVEKDLTDAMTPSEQRALRKGLAGLARALSETGD
jgi:DNA-binding MarR family transcriptional regulator